MPSIEIRPAPIALKGRITELCRETYEAHRIKQPFNWPANHFELAIKPLIDADFVNEKGKSLAESRTAFVAMKDGEFCGYIRVTGWSKGFGGEFGQGSINDIFVVPELRGLGAAKALIDHVKAIATEHDWDTLEATVAEWNSASKSLFEQAGFVVKSHEYRFGPDRKAADLPNPVPQSMISKKDWFWIVLTAVNIAIIIVLLAR